MNALRTASNASRSVRLFFTAFFAAALLAGLLTSASLAGMKPAPAHGLGAALALIAQVRTLRAQAAAATDSIGNTHAPNGRTLIDHRLMRAGALLKARAATTGNVVPISSPVQTYDVFNPPPAFRPLIGYGDVNNLDNNPADKPIYTPDNTLSPTNLTPIWSSNESYLVFSSNRTLTGGIQADGRFHLWAISINGGEAFQITTSTPQTGEDPNLPHGEFFPALNQSNLKIAFTSDSQTPNTRNLYVIGFSFATLSAGGVAPINISDPTAVSSLTLRASTEAGSAALTGFTNVHRPTFSPVDDQLIVFSALSINGTYKNLNHLYFLYQSSGGFSQGNNISYPGKLTDGPANDTDPAYSPDGQFIAFASTATSIAVRPDGAVLFGPNPPSSPQNPDDSQSFTTVTNNPGALRSIFLISGGGSGNGVGFGQPQTSNADSANNPQKTSITTFGTDNYGPAWSNFANQNQFTNPTSNLGYLAFARASAVIAKHDIYYMQAATGLATPSSETLTAEGSSAVVLLNSDDNSGEITQAGTGETSNTGNGFDDVYPAWSPFLSVFSIVYSSSRTVTYNDPLNGTPREIAVSAAPGSTLAGQDALSGYSVGTNYAGLLISQVLNLDPPTLLRFSQDEVVHVQAAGPLDGSGNSADPVNGTPNKLAVAGGQKITLTVRLSNREAGIDNTTGPNGGPRVYVQIKDPNSKYQDAKGQEHKVFAKDRQYDNNPVRTANNFFFEPQPNRPINDVTSGTANFYFGNNTGFRYGQNPGLGYQPEIKYFYPSIPSPQGNVPVQYITDLFQFDSNLNVDGTSVYTNPVGITAVGGGMRGAHGGQWAVDATNNPQNTYIFVGKQHGGSNPGLRFGGAAVNGFPNGFPGGDPRLFVPTGPEYECQVVNPQFASSGNALAPADPTPLNAPISVGDFFSPYWLAGIDDQGAFSGGVFTGNTGAAGLSVTNPPNGFQQTDRPTANYTTTDANNNTVQNPAEWLQMKPVAGAQQDNLGGVLYTITWTTPITGSDFYVDVIAYDKAVFPNIPTSRYVGLKTNWRIYDNVGGFSTNQSIGNNDILLVSDYALGQKFAATTFGGRNANLNLIPKQFGTESYLTDIDVNVLPDRVLGGIVKTNMPTPAWDYDPVLQPFGLVRAGTDNVSFGSDPNFFEVTAQNGLGVGSYIDNVIYDGNTQDGAPNVLSQRYSIWRVLSRGPVPQTVLNSYLPTPVQQPAIQDPSRAAGDAAYTAIPAAKVLDANRCVIWLSPYTGNVLADPGTIDDPGAFSRPNAADRQSTKTILRGFVQAGGRLCVTGQTTASTLTQGGTVDDTAPGGFLPDVLNATLAATSGGSNVLTGTNNRITGNPFYDGTFAGRYMTLSGAFAPPSYFAGFGYTVYNYPYQDNLVLGNADFNDSALSQVPPLTLPTGASIQQQISTLAPANGATTAITYANGQAALVYHDDPYLGGTAGLATTATPGVLPNGGTGSRVVFAAFGLEALTNDYFSPAAPSNDTNDTTHFPAYDRRIPPVIPRNPRPAIIHNIVNYLRTGRVSGTITQTSGTGQGGGLGIQKVTVYLRPTNGAPPTRAAFSALTDTGGNFTIVGVEPGRYTLVAYKAGFQRAVSNSNVSFTLEGDVTLTGATLTLTPLSPGAIAGVVKDTSGTQINGATVTFTSQDQSITKKIVTVNGSVTGSTTENYLLAGVPPTLYTATATSPQNNQNLPEYTNATTADKDSNNFDQGVTVQPSTTTQPVNFTLTPILAQITGRIYDNSSAGGDNATGGALVAGATVTVTNAAGTVVGTATAAADGTYTVSGIPATQTLASYTVTVTNGGYTPATATVSLMLGNVLTGQDIGLAPIPPAQIVTSVKGTILDAQSGAGIGAVTVMLTDSTGTVVGTATTAADGTYTFTQFPVAKTAATYTISAAPTGYVPGSLQIPIKLGDQLTGENITLNETATFYGLVKDSTGAPLPGVSITLLDPNGAVVPSASGLVSAGTTSTGPDGKPENFSATITPTTALPGTYTLVVAKASYDPPTTPITFTLTNKTPVRIDATLTSSIGTLGGLVTDAVTGGPEPGATITVTNSNKVVVATLTTNSSAVTGPDGSPINYQGQIGKGTYTATLTLGDRTPIVKAVTVLGGQFTRLDFTGTTAVQPLYTFPAGLQFVSTPYDYSTLGFDGLFGALGVNRSHVAVWDPTVGVYQLDPTPPADSLRLGTGYWVYLKAPVPVTQQGPKPTGTVVSVTLHPFWNQIGVPNAKGIAVANLLFANGAGGTLTFAQAASSQYHLVSPTLYIRQGNSYQPVDQTGTLQPWQGYWIKVYANATLEMPTGN